MRVIGLMGAIGCGKGTIADILVKDYGFNSIATGDLVREEVTKMGLNPSREVTTKVSEELRRKDPAYFIKAAIKRIKESNWDKVVIDGIRLPIDVKTFKQAFPGIIFIMVKVNPEKRFKRMKLRARPGCPETFKKFLEHERLEIKEFNLHETWKAASRVINNDWSLNELRTQVIEMLEDLGWT